MKKSDFDDWVVKRAERKGFALPFIIFFVGLFYIIESLLNIDDTIIKAKGEIVSISKDTTELKINGEELPFFIPSHIDKSSIHKGDYVEILYAIYSQEYNTIKQLKVNSRMIYEYSWWNNNKISVWVAIIGAILIPIVIKERNRDVRKGEYDPAGPMLASILQVYPEEDDNEPTDIDYKEHSSIINEDNLVYDSDMDYSVYKTDDKEIISVVFSDENGVYCRYFTLPDTEGKDYSQLAELASDIRNNAENYAEIEIDA
ncbi:MAG: hypothetical protein IKO46_05380 [Salinivirgaceae bacterium]|nr:hypothetical protein [Salinivirgaceae bacterium]MBR4620394.1 hypothetical protein [Salinivirgaceae bacterium]